MKSASLSWTTTTAAQRRFAGRSGAWNELRSSECGHARQLCRRRHPFQVRPRHVSPKVPLRFGTIIDLRCGLSSAYDRSMRTQPTLRLLAAFVGFAFSGLAQMDASKFATDLRATYGPPLTRETFMIPAGEMVVDYSTNGHVCRIQLPPVAPDDRQPGVKSAKALDDFLLKLVPPSLRGKELRKLYMAMGAPAASMIEYENVTISEVFQDRLRTGVTVTFKNESCAEKPAQ